VDAARALFTYDFPLNVRELEQALSAALVLASGAAITPAHLPDKIRASRMAFLSSRPPAVRQAGDSRSPEDSAVYDALVAALEETGGNVSEVARRMGKARQQIQRWVRRFRLEPGNFRKS